MRKQGYGSLYDCHRKTVTTQTQRLPMYVPHSGTSSIKTHLRIKVNVKNYAHISTFLKFLFK